MIGLGVNPSNAAGYADRILAWRASTEAGDDDPREFLLSHIWGCLASRVTRRSPRPKNCGWCAGIPPLIVEKMLPFVTVFSNLASVNILDAAPQVVAALPGMTPENLQEVLAQRGDPALDPRSLLAMTGGEGATLAGFQSLPDDDRSGIERRGDGARGGGRDPASRKR